MCIVYTKSKINRKIPTQREICIVTILLLLKRYTVSTLVLRVSCLDLRSDKLLKLGIIGRQ